jgi:hypothetical protein
MAAFSGIHLLRPGVFNNALAPQTISRLKANILKFFGYLMSEKRWEARDLTLVAYSNREVMGAYVEFLSQRGLKLTEIKKHVSTAVKINKYLVNVMKRDQPGGRGERWAEQSSEPAKALRYLNGMLMEISGRRRRELGALVR